MRAVEVGHDVVGLDVDAERAELLSAGESFVEDVASKRLAAALETGRYRATAEPAGAEGFDVAVITVPTPLREGLPDLAHIEAAARSLAPYLRAGSTVVLESTTYPGTTEELLGPTLAEVSGLRPGTDFHLGYSPERIDPGNQMWTLVNTPKVVSGVDAAALVAVQGFYDSIVERTVPVSTPKEAELTKLLENTFRHVNIALVNELAMFAHDLGINVWEAIDAASTKPFGYLRFTPGPGVGGHCLPIDPSYLSWRVKRALGRSFRFVELANDVNQHMPDYAVQRLMVALNHERRSLNGSRILVLGLAYKKNTGDSRESPSARVVELLTSLGSDVRCADPSVNRGDPPPNVTLVDVTADEVRSADAVLLLVDHDAFDFDLITTNARFVLDTRNRLSGPRVEAL